MSSLEFRVCPHDTAKEPDRWFRFAQYLSQRLETPVHFAVALDFDEFHQGMAQNDLIYVNPSDTVALTANHGFCPIARVIGQSDEVVFIANPSIDSPSLTLIDGGAIATVSSMLASKLALQLLHRQAIIPAEVVDRPTWLSVMGAVAKGTPAYGIVYKDTYDQMAQSTKSMVNAFATSNEKLAFHTFAIGPGAMAHKDTLATLLTTMATDPKGQEILQTLHIDGWQGVTPADLAPIQALVA
ncbi:PhnD/SsuA/transferrin family substrate-binding protein [Phormidium sp. FACHB-1136]|jgi:ABC-type phosphate/phosphonate transport system substrate-binding protein|uniref:phosphate/phosphite/phosphonate ABC transporter substrate-binding protein n=1 Tax=Phormidium sp. FACHB-1136 TaxID=2692848 RepID=UPI00168256D1|nr:PhnD/SsuA/transferrin family substrate-binding protein [Phormidium sp. FACHB-1136]MBD2428253.1 PhnD/SsuA/transferrin family substrate-binding protein [Phormidium sp. FACHB-1136]